MHPSPPLSGGSVTDPFLERVRGAVAPKYSVSRLLGRGGMASVFLATETRLGRDVALKVMAPDLMADPGMVERFAHEARTTAQLTSPWVVTVYDVDEREGLHFFTMRYVGGRTLGQVMDWSLAPLPIPVVQAWMTQVAGALSHAHRKGVIHRDVKPSNVLIDVEGTALVSDFGIAKLVLGDPNLTQTGQIVGTPTYMSPEQCIGGAITPASDQYAFGAVAYQMVTGTPPFTGPTLSVLNAQVSEPPAPVLSRRPDCPRALASGIERMLAKAPEHRWAGMDEALEGMELTLPPQSDPVWRRMEALAIPVAGVRVESAPSGLRPGGTGVLQAVAVDASGRPLRDRRILWESSSPGLLQVDPSGRVEALGAGMMTVVARCEGAEARVAVPVAPDDTVVLAPPPPPPAPLAPPPPAPSSLAPPQAAAGALPTPPNTGGTLPPHRPPAGSLGAGSGWSPPGGGATEPSSPPPTGTEPGAGRSPSRTPLLAVGGALVLILAVVTGIWALNRGSGEAAAGLGDAVAQVAPGAEEVATPEGEGPTDPSEAGAGEGEEGPAQAAETPPPAASTAAPSRSAPGPAAPPPVAQREPPPAAAPAPQPTTGAEAIPPPATPEAAPSAEVQQITAIARRLMEAVANQNEAGIRAEYQAFTGSEPWWRFASDSTGDYGRTVRLLPQTQVIPIGNTATVIFSLSIDLVDDDGTVANQRTYPLTMRFERGDDGWWLADLR